MNELGKSLLAVAFILCCVFGCSLYNSYRKDKQHEERLAKKRQDSLRVAFIKDSLAHDPRYQDSLRRAEIAYNKWKIINDSISREEIVGFILLSDGKCYRTVIHPLITRADGVEHNYSEFDIPDLRFVTEIDVMANHYELCEECEAMQDVYSDYELGLLIEANE